jgi:hypothetical protein
VSMDRNREQFTAAFPYEDGRTLFVLKEPRRCRGCGVEVRLVVEAMAQMPVCVPCAESRRLELAGEKPPALEVTACSACKNIHRIPPWGLRRIRLGGSKSYRTFNCPTTGTPVDVFDVEPPSTP